MMRLALETATDFCSVALEVDGKLYLREALAPRKHAELLLPWITELLAEADCNYADLDALAVSHGPGGFTSLRIGLAVAQGIALAHDLPIHPVSTLAVLAHAVDPEARGGPLLAVLDARMQEVYAGWFLTEDGRHVAAGPEQVLPPSQLVAPTAGPWRVAGSGLDQYPEAVEQALGVQMGEGLLQRWPHAKSVLALAGSVPAVPAWELEPVYVRDQVTG